MSTLRIQFRHDTAMTWYEVNPVLSDGEPAYETDTKRWKIGDGETPWRDLDYMAEDGGSGPPGPPGPASTVPGPQGERGIAGPEGPSGPPNSLSVGTVQSGSQPAASISGVAPSQVLNLILPKGDRGEKGETGSAGAANQLQIGEVATGTNAAASISGSSPNQVLNLVLPRGEQGPPNTLGIGSVQAGSSVTDASASISGSAPNQMLNLVLPRGPKGDAAGLNLKGVATTWPPSQSPQSEDLWVIGETIPSGTPSDYKAGYGAFWTGTAWLNVGPIRGPEGPEGPAGPATTLSIGTVVPGSSPSDAQAFLSGDSPSQVLSLVLPKGDPGEAASLEIGTVADGSAASASISGSAPNQKLNLVLPSGPAGPANSLSIGTVSVSDDSTGSVQIFGNSPNQVLNFVLPRGKQGNPGENAQPPSISIGTVSQGESPSASITGSAPDFTLNLVLPNPSITHVVSFIESPKSITVDDGVPVTLTALASATESPITYKWQRMGLSNWEDIPGAGGDTYSFTSSASASGRRYRCVAATPSGATGYSAIAMVTVRPAVPADGSEWVGITGNSFVDTTVSYANDKFISRRKWSPDGQYWYPTDGDNRFFYSKVVYGNGFYFAGDAKSIDGVSFSRVSGAGSYVICTAFAGNKFLVLDSIGSAYITVDGNSLSRVTPVDMDDQPILLEKFVGSPGGLFFGVCRRQSGRPRQIIYSQNGINWQETNAELSDQQDASYYGWSTHSAIAYAEGFDAPYIVAGHGNQVWSSPDGINWNLRTLPTSGAWSDAAYGNGLLMMVAKDNSASVLTSTDGISWSVKNTLPESGDWTSVAFGAGVWAAVKDSVKRLAICGVDFSTEVPVLPEDYNPYVSPPQAIEAIDVPQNSPAFARRVAFPIIPANVPPQATGVAIRYRTAGGDRSNWQYATVGYGSSGSSEFIQRQVIDFAELISDSSGPHRFAVANGGPVPGETYVYQYAWDTADGMTAFTPDSADSSSNPHNDDWVIEPPTDHNAWWNNFPVLR